MANILDILYDRHLFQGLIETLSGGPVRVNSDRRHSVQTATCES